MSEHMIKTFFEAIRLGNLKTVQFLLDKGIVTLHQVLQQGGTYRPLQYALMHKQSRIVAEFLGRLKKLFDAGSETNWPKIQEATEGALYAAIHGSIDNLQALLKQPRFVDPKSIVPYLIWCITDTAKQAQQEHYLQALELLMESDYDIRTEAFEVHGNNHIPKTPLLHQAAHRSYQLTKALWALEANLIKQTDDEGCLPIHHADTQMLVLVAGEKMELVKATNKKGQTPLHLWPYCPERAELLLHMGADPNATDDTLQTPLMQTIRNCNSNYSADVIKVLLKHGTNVTAVDKAGYTAIDYAKWHSDSKTLLPLLNTPPKA